MEDKLQHLTEDQQEDLPRLLQNFEHLFGVIIGTWKMDPIYFKLKENSKPV